MDVVAGARQDAHLEAAREAAKPQLAKRATPEPGPAAMEVDAEMTAAELGDLGGGMAASFRWKVTQGELGARTAASSAESETST